MLEKLTESSNKKQTGNPITFNTHYFTHKAKTNGSAEKGERKKDLKTCPMTEVTLKYARNPLNIPSNSWTSVVPFLLCICTMRINSEKGKKKKERKLGFENQKTEVESVFYLAAGDCRSNG